MLAAGIGGSSSGVPKKLSVIEPALLVPTYTGLQAECLTYVMSSCKTCMRSCTTRTNK
jgi:hypothetical protein